MSTIVVACQSSSIANQNRKFVLSMLDNGISIGVARGANQRPYGPHQILGLFRSKVIFLIEICKMLSTNVTNRAVRGLLVKLSARLVYGRL